jgi:hypothetical protein
MSAVLSDRAPGAVSAQRSIDELDAAIGRVAAHLNAESYRMLALVREFDDRFGWMKWSFRNCAEWLAWRCQISLSAAREKVRTAQALRNLPAISAAFADGRLSYSKVRALTRVANMANEDLLLAYALQANAARVEERCRQIRNVSPASAHLAQRAWERRSLTAWRNEANGTLRITVELPIEEGELIVRALDRAVEAGEAATGFDPDAGVEARGSQWCAQQADALVAVAKAYLCGASADEQTTSDHYQVVVHVDDSALRGGQGRADLPIDTIERLTCDGSLLTIVEDERGMPLDVGRRQRTVSTRLKRALWARDGGCTFPGCHGKRYVDAHHIRHWVKGGETSVENLTLLCSFHHRLLHEGGFRAQRDELGGVRFERADGRVIPRCGYRLEDVADDDVENPSSEGMMSAHGYSAAPSPWHTSAEVREGAALYVVT